MSSLNRLPYIQLWIVWQRCSQPSPPPPPPPPPPPRANCDQSIHHAEEVPLQVPTRSCIEATRSLHLASLTFACNNVQNPRDDFANGAASSPEDGMIMDGASAIGARQTAEPTPISSPAHATLETTFPASSAHPEGENT